MKHKGNVTLKFLLFKRPTNLGMCLTGVIHGSDSMKSKSSIKP